MLCVFEIVVMKLMREVSSLVNNKKTLKEMKDGRVATSDGQIIEGMTVTQGAPSFYVEVAK